jgi:hypothetical protein
VVAAASFQYLVPNVAVIAVVVVAWTIPCGGSISSISSSDYRTTT